MGIDPGQVVSLYGRLREVSTVKGYIDKIRITFLSWARKFPIIPCRAGVG